MTLALGEVTLDRVVEIGRSAYPTTSMLPDSTPEALARHHAWLKPDFWDDAVGDLGARIQTWIVRTPRTTVLIDTGVGNGKARPDSPVWHMREGAWLEDLAAAGVGPEQVGVVPRTPLPGGHLGWDTRRGGALWESAFCRAGPRKSQRIGSRGSSRACREESATWMILFMQISAPASVPCVSRQAAW